MSYYTVVQLYDYEGYDTPLGLFTDYDEACKLRDLIRDRKCVDDAEVIPLRSYTNANEAYYDYEGGRYGL